MTPFALTSPAQFLPPGPPPLTSARYAQDLAQVQALGSAASTTRTAEQTQTAIFWQDDTPAAMWNRVADQLAQAHHATLTQNARLLAQLNIRGERYGVHRRLGDARDPVLRRPLPGASRAGGAS